MADNSEDGLYQRLVEKVNAWGAPHLHRTTDKFIERSIRKHAQDNPKLQELIKFEVQRRAYGPGQTQDFAEPAIWMVVKTFAALAIAGVAELFKSRTVKAIGLSTALVIIANNVVEAFRFTPRFVAGLQGSEKMALERWKAIQTTGVDPFSASQKTATVQPQQAQTPQEPPAKQFTDTISPKPEITSTSLMDAALNKGDKTISMN